MNQKLIPGKIEINHTLLKNYRNYPKPVVPIPVLRGTPHSLLLSSGLVIETSEM